MNKEGYADLIARRTSQAFEYSNGIYTAMLTLSVILPTSIFLYSLHKSTRMIFGNIDKNSLEGLADSL